MTSSKAAVGKMIIPSEIPQQTKSGGPGLPYRSERHDHRPVDSMVGVALLGDLAAILAGLLFGFWLRFKSGAIPVTDTWWTSGDTSNVSLSDYLGLISLGAGMLVVTFSYLDLYRARNLLRFRSVAAIMLRGLCFWFIAYLGLSLVLKFSPPISRIYVLSSTVAVALSIIAWRTFFHRVFLTGKIAASLRQRVLFIGWTEDATRLSQAIRTDPSQPYEIVGCLPAPGNRFSRQPEDSIQKLGTYDDMYQWARRGQVEIVILVDLDPSMHEVIELTNLCEREMIQFKVIPSYFQIMVSGLHLETISGVPILGVSELPLDRLFNRFLKRSVDIIGSIFGVTISIPAIVVCGILIYLESPGPVFFRQERVGRRGQRFGMLKLRSMKIGADQEDHLNQSTLRDDPRMLRVGSFIRRWNLDELPQFWNVLRGEMSLVGPRPERTYHSERLSCEVPHYNARLACKPGMTGWAQIHGLRGDTDLTQRVRYDLFYLENWSLMLDFQIMAMTFVKNRNAY